MSPHALVVPLAFTAITLAASTGCVVRPTECSDKQPAPPRPLTRSVSYDSVYVFRNAEKNIFASNRWSEENEPLIAQIEFTITYTHFYDSEIENIDINLQFPKSLDPALKSEIYPAVLEFIRTQPDRYSWISYWKSSPSDLSTPKTPGH